MAPTEPLHERDAEMAAMAGAIDRARRGAGAAVLVEGPGGIGKSSLLAQGAEVARRAGLRVLSARAAELEQGFASGVVRQLFERAVASAGAAERGRWLAGAAATAGPLLAGTAPADGRDEAFARLHGLYWLCANLAADQPLALVVDDAQWADDPSLELLGFLARRAGDLPLVLLVATRPLEEASRPLLDQLAADPAVTTIRPAPLTAAAVGSLAADVFGAAPEPGFAEACHAATGGNPFLAHELLREAAAEGLAPAAESAERLRALGPRGVTRVILLRLGRLPAPAAEVARAVAVLGDGAGVRDVAALAGAPEGAAAQAAARLAAAGILAGRERLAFAHPLVRAIVLDDLDPIEREARHAAAARLRRERGATPAEVASHLLRAGPELEPWAAGALREAGGQALALGDPAAAVAALRRALDAAGDGERDAILGELARAEARAGRPEAVDRLREAVASARDPEALVARARELAGVLTFADRAVEAIGVLRDAEARLAHAPEVAAPLEVGLVATAYISLKARALVADRVAAFRDTGGTPGSALEALQLAGATLDAIMASRPASEVAAMGRRALAFPLPADPVPGSNHVLIATVALAFAERLDEVDAIYRAALADARRRGAAIEVAAVSSLRAMVSYRRGALLEAEADARAALDLAAEVRGAEALMVNALAYAIHTGIDRGDDLDALAGLAAQAEPGEAPDLIPTSQLVVAHARLALERGDLAGALARYRSCDRPEAGWGAGGPTVIPWRSGAALALARMGEAEEAQELAAAEVALARAAQTPRALGMALRAVALAGPARDRVAALRAAADVLDGVPLERARTLCDLGAALRAEGERAAARGPLRDAHDLAARCGATALASRAREELAAAGARPRAVEGVGAGELTPSERRIAAMAADGATNRIIAQALFLSEK
ncbi:MAG TPA: AAA family ATPase, partial [Solirubrobacteraceae bacterium]